MQKSKLVRKGRKGFTLVEVALAVAVGLIIIGGAVLGYNAVKDNASNSNARNRVLSGVTMVEEYAAANGGRYPASVAGASGAAGGSFSTMWKAKRTDDFNLSPWGGETGDVSDGVTEVGPTAAAAADASGAAAIELAHGITAGGAEAANMNYVSLTRAGANTWSAITAGSTSSKTTFKNYALGIADKNGNAFWDVKGGK